MYARIQNLCKPDFQAELCGGFSLFLDWFVLIHWSRANHRCDFFYFQASCVGIKFLSLLIHNIPSIVVVQINGVTRCR